MAYTRPTRRHYDLQKEMHDACFGLNQAVKALNAITGENSILNPPTVTDDGETIKGFEDVCPENHIKAFRKLSEQLAKRERDLYGRACRMGIAW